MRAGAIIQTRMGSSRFPGKVLRDLCGATVLERVIERLQWVPEIDVIVVATTVASADDPIVDLCRQKGILCFRGDEWDVLDRYCQAAAYFHLDCVVRVCSDAPLVDPEGITYLFSKFDGTHFVTNRFPGGWAPGTAADLMTYDALVSAHKNATAPDEREHVIPFMLNHPEQFNVIKVPAPPTIRRSHFHLSIDYPQDLEFFRLMFNRFCMNQAWASLKVIDVIAWLDQAYYRTL